MCLFVLGVATDGVTVALVRVSSGAPAAGGSFAHASPCPAFVTKAMPLLEWDFRSTSGYKLPVGAPPPAGFVALARLLNAPPAALGDGAPLASLRVAVRWLLPIEQVAVGVMPSPLMPPPQLRLLLRGRKWRRRSHLEPASAAAAPVTSTS